MNCTTSPPLTELDLLRYLDREGDTVLAQHIAGCPACRDKVTALVQQNNAIVSQLYRSMCPSPAELRDYRLNLLTRVENGNIALHLVRCPHCTRELFVLDQFLPEEPGPIANVVYGIKFLSARLASTFNTADLLPAGARGDTAPPQIYESDDLQIGLEIEVDKQTGTYTIKGLITGENLNNLFVHLWRNDTLVATAQVDNVLGDFQFTSLLSANYELIVSAQETKVRLPQIAV